MARKKVSINDLYRKKAEGEKVSWLTCYDFPTAQFQEAAGIEMILVGDSMGMCVYGYQSTVPVTMDQCIVHADAVRRGAPTAFVMGDMPFMSYQESDQVAVANAGRFLKQANVDAIKLEGGIRTVSRIRAIVDAGIVVCGHIGLTPQSSGQLGGTWPKGVQPILLNWSLRMRWPYKKPVHTCYCSRRFPLSCRLSLPRNSTSRYTALGRGRTPTDSC